MDRPVTASGAPRRRPLVARFAKWLLYAIALFVVGSVGLTIIYRWVAPPVTPLMIGRWIEYKFSGESAGIDYRWRPLEEISPNL